MITLMLNRSNELAIHHRFSIFFMRFFKLAFLQLQHSCTEPSTYKSKYTSTCAYNIVIEEENSYEFKFKFKSENITAKRHTRLPN